MTIAYLLLASLLVACPLQILTLNPSNSSAPAFFQDVLNKISSRQKWERHTLGVSGWDARKARFWSARRYEFWIRIGKRTELYFKFSDDEAQARSWKKVTSIRGGKEGGDLEEVVRDVRRMSVLDSFKLEGPFEMWIADGDRGFMLSLPHNWTHTGLRRVLVSEGITVEVYRARKVHLLHTSESDSLDNDDIGVRNGFWSHWRLPLCVPLFPIRVFGSAFLIAYRTRNPDGPIETDSPSKGVIELLPEKCHNVHVYKEPRSPFDGLVSRIATLERVLRSLAGDQMRKDKLLRSVKIEVKVETVIRLWIQIERKATANETSLTEEEEQGSRPTVKKLWFDVVARVDKDSLKPLLINKVQPFVAVDTVALSSLLSNISFTKLPSILGPEALTLGVKW